MDVVCGTGESTCAGGVVDGGVLGGGGDEGEAEEVVAGADGVGFRRGRGLLVEVGYVGFHLWGGEEGDVVQVQGGEDVGLEIGV